MGYEVSVEVSKCIEEVSELILFIFSSYFPILCRYGIEGVSGYRSIGYVSGYGYGRSVKYPCNLAASSAALVYMGTALPERRAADDLFEETPVLMLPAASKNRMRQRRCDGL